MDTDNFNTIFLNTHMKQANVVWKKLWIFLMTVKVLFVGISLPAMNILLQTHINILTYVCTHAEEKRSLRSSQILY